jgi:chaperonin GroES
MWGVEPKETMSAELRDDSITTGRLGDTQEGELISVGPGGRDESGKLIQVGDLVLLGKWCATAVKIDDAEYLIMKKTDVMGVMSGTEARKKAA